MLSWGNLAGQEERPGRQEGKAAEVTSLAVQGAPGCYRAPLHSVMSAMWACLVLSVLLGWGCIASGKAQQPGTPLSDQEYHQFFMSLRAAGRASTACLLRMLYGCQNPLVQRLDEYENHGAIPEGPVCSELPGNPFFPNFCTFSLYRCTRKWYFIKRTACPGELGRTQASNDKAMSSDAMSSSIFRPELLFPMSPATTQPAHSITDTEIVVIPASSPESKNMQPNPSNPHATEVMARGQQRGQLPTSDIQDLLLRLQDPYVQSSAQILQWLLTMGNVVRETEVQAAALRLLADLNNARVSQRAASTDTGHRRER